MTEYTKKFDYEKAADHWTERDRNSSHMEDDALKNGLKDLSTTTTPEPWQQPQEILSDVRRWSITSLTVIYICFPKAD